MSDVLAPADNAYAAFSNLRAYFSGETIQFGLLEFVIAFSLIGAVVWTAYILRPRKPIHSFKDLCEYIVFGR